LKTRERKKGNRLNIANIELLKMMKRKTMQQIKHCYHTTFKNEKKRCRKLTVVNNQQSFKMMRKNSADRVKIIIKLASKQ
jgi:hypothetical protein